MIPSMHVHALLQLTKIATLLTIGSAMLKCEKFTALPEKLYQFPVFILPHRRFSLKPCVHRFYTMATSAVCKKFLGKRLPILLLLGTVSKVQDLWMTPWPSSRRNRASCLHFLLHCQHSSIPFWPIQFNIKARQFVCFQPSHRLLRLDYKLNHRSRWGPCFYFHILTIALAVIFVPNGLFW